MSNSLPIVSITPLTLQDFPGLVASILWFTGCNFRCPYCHNPDMALGRGKRLPSEKIETFLRNRVDFVDGIVLSGGECTLNPDVVEFARFVKSLRYQLKVDTNGSKPDTLQRMLSEGLIDYVAMDFKAPLEEYEKVTSWNDVEAWKHSLSHLLESAIRFEIRTTVHSDLVSESDVSLMMKELVDLGYRGRYYVQNFSEGETLKGLAKPEKRFDVELLETPSELDLNLRNFTEREERIIR